ncbi:hypothetical protein BC940DRAFT_316343 [Gongronella butleri]|nr:hypothetical protein BC940DRAFT_316343 [Gongronella butleri]
MSNGGGLFSSSLDMRIHPLSATPNSSSFFQPGTLADEVSTVFIVGFPDDMTEREFQNMFTFCPGFEAASLKWHSKDQEDDTSISSNGGKKQMIGFARFRTRLEAMEAVDVLSGKKIDQEKGTMLKAEMAKKNLHIKRGSVAPINNTFASNSTQHTASTSGTLTPTSMTNGATTSPPNNNHAAAAAAAAAATTMVANGLHGTSFSTPATSASTSSSNAAAISAPAPAPAPAAPSTIGDGTLSLLSRKLGRQSQSSASFDAFSPLPSDLLSPADFQQQQHKMDPFLPDPFSSPSTPIFGDSLFTNLRSNSFDARPPNDLGIMSPPRHFGTGVVPPSSQLSSSFTSPFSQISTSSSQHHLNGTANGSQQQPHQQQQHQQQQHPHPLAAPAPHTHTHPLHHPHPLHQQQHQQHPLHIDDDFSYLSKSSPVSNDRLFGTSPLLDDLLASRMNSLTVQATNVTDLRSPSVPSIHRPSNPADQNPPCNTLYVGNLPPSTNEDELRQLFSKCRGYKRMCFRNKPQGPMCFVEFEDVTLATQALNDHQGHCLTTSIKGGIRLSFSKNPLFIKGPGNTTIAAATSSSSNSSNASGKASD